MIKWRSRHKSQSQAKGFQQSSSSTAKQLQTLILEPILTPSGLVDGFDDTLNPVDIDLSDTLLPDTLDLDSVDIANLPDLPEPIEDIPFINDLDINASPFDSGVFTVGDDGQVSIDFLFDGGAYEGELAIFSLDGMDQYEPGSDAFIREAANRALSDSELGHVVIRDKTEGARFSGDLGEHNWNKGDHISADDKVFAMGAGDEFGIMLVPKGTVQQVFDNPDVGGATRPLFSMATANPDDAFHVGQIADVTGDGNTFVFEDMRVDGGSDQDYNDLIFQVKGATAEAVDLDQVIDPDLDWRDTELGQELIEHTEQTVFEVELDTLEKEFVEDLDLNLNTLETLEQTELPEFSAELDLTFEDPTPLLDEAIEALPEDLTITLDDVSTLLEEEIAKLSETSNPTLTDTPAPLPDTLDNALGDLGQNLNNQEAALSELASQDLNILSQAPAELTLEVDGLSEELAALKTAILAEVPELPTDLAEAFQEMDTLIAEVKTDIATDIDTQSLRLLMDELLTEAAVDNDGSNLFLSSPLYIGSQNPFTNKASTDVAAPVSQQPLIGVIDTGFDANHPDLDYTKIILGRDRIDGDNNPLSDPTTDNGGEHGTHVLGLIAATRDNNLGIDGLNDDAPVWLGRAVGSGQWANALIEFVDAAKASGQPNAVINLSFDLVTVQPDGTVVPRYELTEPEKAALTYARQNGVLIVAAAGNDNGQPSALGQASLSFDNIITVGAANLGSAELEQDLDPDDIANIDRASYSNYGPSLDILAAGGTDELPIVSTLSAGLDGGLGLMAGTSAATARVTGAISQVWAANPQLSYQQVIDLLKTTATDLKTPGWDAETGAGLINLAAAVSAAIATTPDLNKITLGSAAPTPDGTNPNPEDISEREAFFKKLAKKVVGGIKKVAKKVVGGVKKVTQKITGGIKRGISRIWGGIKRIGRRIGRGLLSPINKVLGRFKIFRKIGNFIRDRIFRPVWNGIKWVGQQLWNKLTGIFQRAGQWITRLPKRVARLISNLWQGVKQLKPWSISWWQSLGKASTWNSFLSWLGKNIIYLTDAVGVGEIYETLADFAKFATRPLNSTEIARAKRVFGNAINYSTARVDTRALLGPSWTGRAYVSFNTINSWGPLEADTFIHEMTHVWQYQKDGAIYMPEAIHAQGNGGYDYGGLSELKKRRTASLGLTSFNREQQADIIRDYYRLREHLETGYGKKPRKEDFIVSTFPQVG